MIVIRPEIYETDEPMVFGTDPTRYGYYVEVASEFYTPDEYAELAAWLYSKRISGVSLNQGKYLVFVTRGAVIRVVTEYPYVSQPTAE